MLLFRVSDESLRDEISLYENSFFFFLLNFKTLSTVFFLKYYCFIMLALSANRSNFCSKSRPKFVFRLYGLFFLEMYVDSRSIIFASSFCFWLSFSLIFLAFSFWDSLFKYEDVVEFHLESILKSSLFLIRYSSFEGILFICRSNSIFFSTASIFSFVYKSSGFVLLLIFWKVFVKSSRSFCFCAFFSTSYIYGE